MTGVRWMTTLLNIASYKCLKCGYKYFSKPGPTQCPECDHLYVKWLNYEKLKREGLINDGWGRKNKA